MFNNIEDEKEPLEANDTEENKNEEDVINDEETSDDLLLNLSNKLIELEEEIVLLKKEKLLALADSQNANKRADKRIVDATKYANTNLCKSLVDVADNLQRAIISIPQDEIDTDVIKKLITGVQMTSKELSSVLESQGVSKIDSLHKKFDPNLHQAMQKIKNDKFESGTIIEVIQDGYMIVDRLLRPAMVIVSEKKDGHLFFQIQ